MFPQLLIGHLFIFSSLHSVKLSQTSLFCCAYHHHRSIIGHLAPNMISSLGSCVALFICLKDTASCTNSKFWWMLHFSFFFSFWSWDIILSSVKGILSLILIRNLLLHVFSNQMDWGINRHSCRKNLCLSSFSSLLVQMFHFTRNVLN